MSDDGERTCPLCAEEMDLTDQQLKPCQCGYEVCVSRKQEETHVFCSVDLKLFKLGSAAMVQFLLVLSSLFKTKTSAYLWNHMIIHYDLIFFCIDLYLVLASYN